jgi:hypothetical protein
MLLVLGLLSVVYANWAHAQVPRVRIQQRSYDVTIVSEFGVPVRVGIFGYSSKATFRLTFDGGRTGPDVYEQELISGDRVVIVWDTKGNRLLVADLRVDSDGDLVLGWPTGAAARSGAAKGRAKKGGAAAAKANEIPRLKIKPTE